MPKHGFFKSAALALLHKAFPADLRSPESRGGWYPIVREGFAGAWQQNVETPIADVLSHPTVYACITKIAGDIAKMRLELVQDIGNDVWVPIESNAFSPVLRKPNHFQTPFQFVQSWMISKLISGNTYVLQQRDNRGGPGNGNVIAQYVLDPWRARPLIAPDGSVFYELNSDALGQVPNTDTGSVNVPASEIIHDRMNPLFHPLVGLSPLYAAGIPAILGLKIVTNSARFFQNGATPGGILTVPGGITQADADAMKTTWETNFGGQNAGRIAVMADGMAFKAIEVMSSDKAQTTEQWQAASEAIANAYSIPWSMVGGPTPPYTNPQSLSVLYLTQCIQHHTKPFEDVYDFGVGLAPQRIGGVRMGVQFNVNDLLLMDTATQMTTIAKGIGAAVLSPNDGRAQINLPPVDGGSDPIAQQQNWPLSVLAKRPPPTATQPAARVAEPQDMDEDEPMPMAASFASLHTNDCRARLNLKAVAAA